MSEDETGDGVLSNLPSTRPQRRSSKRDAPMKKSGASGAAARTVRSAPDKPAAAAARTQRRRPPSSTARERPRSAPVAPDVPPEPVAAQGFEPSRARQVTPPSNGDIVVSAVRAAGELAQVGLTLGEHLARAAARRLRL